MIKYSNGVSVFRRVNQHGTDMRIRCHGMEINVQIRASKSPTRRRRAIALMLFKAMRPVLGTLNHTMMTHDIGGGWETWSGYQEHLRPVSLKQALGVETDLKKLGAIIRLRRTSLQISQSELSDHTGLSRVHISRIEHGHHEAQPKNLIKIIDVLNQIEWANNRVKAASHQLKA